MEERKPMRCPHCGAALAHEASFCPHCERVLIEKRPAPMPSPRRRRKGLFLAALAVLLLIAALARDLLPRGRVIDAQGAELIYETEGRSFHLALRFGTQEDAPFESEADFAEYIREDWTSGQTIDSRLFVDNGGRSNEKEAFLALMDRFTVETTLCSGLELLQIEETFIPDNTGATLEAVPRYETAVLKNGESDILWTIYMKNGDELHLRHRMRLLRLPVVTYTPDDHPMETAEELNALFRTLAQEGNDETAVYVLELPAVTYQGEVYMEDFCCDLVGSGEGGGTVFADTLYINRRGVHPSNIADVRFEGDGAGFGLSATEGVCLHNCTFENWEVGAYGGDGSWVNASGCTFRGNGVGLWLDNHRGTTCSASYYGDSLYESNGTALRIDAMPNAGRLSFSGCVFRGNDTDVDNAARYPIDLSRAVFEAAG